MITIKNEKIAHIPFLHVANGERFNEALPLVIFLHGYTSAKEHNLHYAYLLAEQGFRVVLPDALYHGEREEESLTGKERDLYFWDIVVQGIKEVSLIKEELDKRGFIIDEKVGVAGTSMGAITTFGALSVYEWITAAVSLMGNPCYQRFASAQLAQLQQQNDSLPMEKLQQKVSKLASFDLSERPEILKQRPLLLWHGKKDDVVPYKYIAEFYNTIRPQYRGNEECLTFITDPLSAHKVTRGAVLETVAWFERHISHSRIEA
ncbi:prolyl oligopeptidase family serine peptidase [Desertibacillus haloalkaliphilus]|uniref:prolyl oligopeptidase family serine peptidase n=1 Tax=Desertibacillus haloalkaliphilus TaxID=1328930 RepID=UPI001C25F02F|nr:prolyl oligopeptidase family serine peptidase [Desertibacillus haloalkaliphilus]MBU8908365.1 prolyl oligopeptidase family serine peptidase [Desertibacillus haloalkaliphilus]